MGFESDGFFNHDGESEVVLIGVLLLLELLMLVGYCLFFIHDGWLGVVVGLLLRLLLLTLLMFVLLSLFLLAHGGDDDYDYI